MIYIQQYSLEKTKRTLTHCLRLASACCKHQLLWLESKLTFPGTIIPGNFCFRERKFSGMKVPGIENSREHSFGPDLPLVKSFLLVIGAICSLILRLLYNLRFRFLSLWYVL